MTDQNNPLATEAANPGTAPARLAQIATEQESLRAVVAANPATYPALLDWLDQVGDEHTRATVAWVRSGGHAAAYAASQAAAAQAAVPQPTVPQPPAPHYGAVQPPTPQYGAAQPPTPQYGAVQPPVPQYGATQPYPAAGATQPYPAAGATQQFAAPAGGGYPPAGGYAADANGGTPPRPRRSKKWWFIGIAAGLVVLLAGGGVFAYVTIFSKLGGASSPEASVEKLLTGIADFDAVSLYGAISPSEIGTLEDSFSRLKDIQLTEDGETVDYAELVKAVSDNTTVELKDVEYETEEIAEDISAVSIVSGSVHIDTDPEAVADAYMAVAREQIESQSDDLGYSDEEIEELVTEGREEIVTQLEDAMPFDLDTDQVEETLGKPFSLVSVKEGGSWYISPLLSIGEYALDASGGERGTLVDAAEFGSPEDALQGFLDGANTAISDGDFDELAAALPLAERRFVSLYGSGIAESADYRGAGSGFSVDTLEVTPDVSGDIARIAIDQLVISIDGVDDFTYEISGVCATVVSEYSDDEGCLTDIPQAEKLGLDEARIVAVKEDGDWFVSPLSTLSDIGAIVSEHVVELSNAGELEDLFK
jgi:hypothetical protein